MQRREVPSFFKTLYSNLSNNPYSQIRAIFTSLLIIGFLSAAPAFALVYVDIDASGANNGTTWADAYIDFQDGINNASNEEVWVASGTYFPASAPNLASAPTDRYFHYSLKNGVSVYGGFVGTESDISDRDPETNQTILSGDIGITADTSDNCYHVFYHHDAVGLNNTAVLDGFVISDGYANGSEGIHQQGGGMYNHENSPTISNCLISNNHAAYSLGGSDGGGGGIYNWGSSPIISNCDFVNNTTPKYGGAITITDGTPIISSSSFSGNTAGINGGAINTFNSNTTINDCTFNNNTAIYNGGAIYNSAWDHSFTVNVTNCTFDSNVATNQSGSAIYNSLSNSNITNCTFTGHNSFRIPLLSFDATAVVKNSIFWNGAFEEVKSFSASSVPIPTDVTYSVMSDNYTGTGNTDEDPLLGTLQDNGGPVQTIAIGLAGSAFDATTDGAPATDARGYVRDSTPDRGAYELYTYTVGGTVSGLASGSTVELQNNGGDDLSVNSNGSFDFTGVMLDGESYEVTVLANPTDTPQICSVSNGSGTIMGADISDIAVTCVNSYTVGGSVTGLAEGNSVVLQNNGGDNLTVADNGTFDFTTALADNSTYVVTVLTQPTSPNQTCSVSAGSGTISGADISDVDVTCVNTYTVGGMVSGLASGNTVVLQNNDGDDLSVVANGSFTFTSQFEDSAGYDVTVLTQPSSPNQVCTVSNGTGTISSADIINIGVNCVTDAHTVGGSVSGLAAGNSVVLQNNGVDNLTVDANGSFIFDTPIDDGSSYAVTVFTSPSSPNQTCTISNGSGTILAADITNVTINCVINTYYVGGGIKGLTKYNSVVLQNNDGDNLTRSRNGKFAFPTPLVDGSSYEVTVLTQPNSPGQTCSILNDSGSGTISGSNAYVVNINCVTNTYTVGGNVSGIEPGDSIVLQNNAGDDLMLDADGGFTFASALDDDSIYEITVLTQPTTAGHICYVSNGNGTITDANVTDVYVVCGSSGFPWNMFLPAIMGVNP